MAEQYDETIQTQIRQARGKFICMVSTYALGVLNDNFFKQAAMLLVVFTMGSKAPIMQAIAGAVYVLPFLLFASHAGWLADRFSKRRIVIASKALELVAMLAGAAGFLLMSWPLVLTMLFLMALQSTIFSPAMNGSIPELYPEVYILRANSKVKIITTCGILIGIIIGGAALGSKGESGNFDAGRMRVAIGVVLIALIGLLASFGVVRRPAADPTAKFPWSGPIDTVRHLLHIFRTDALLRVVILGDMVVWFVAVVLSLVINQLGQEMFGLSPVQTSYLLVAQLAGVGIGGGLASMLSEHDRWKKALAPAMLAMGLVLMALGAVVYLPESMQVWAFAAILIPSGIAGGLLLVPLESFFQVRPKPQEKGSVIAAANFAGFLAMGIASAFSGILNLLPIQSLRMSILGVICLPAAVWLFIVFRKGGPK